MSAIELLLCPLCQADTPSTEAFEHFGQVMCAECATGLYDPGDGWPGDREVVT